jgi:hypothetical protein
MSTELMNSVDIIDENTYDRSNYQKINRMGGINSLIKMYNPLEFMYKKVIWNKYNFTGYFEQAKNKKLLERSHSDLKLKSDFFISVDDGVANELVFGSKSKYGFLIDADSYVSSNFKNTYTKKYEINNNKMIVNVDNISNTQQQRRSLKNDIGFLIINTPGNYVSSLGVRGIRVYLIRRNEAGSDIPVIQ